MKQEKGSERNFNTALSYNYNKRKHKNTKATTEYKAEIERK